MGLFDTLWINCPKCSEPYEAQSKAGPCNLNNYSIADAPLAVLADVAETTGIGSRRYNPYTCQKCQTLFFLMLKVFAVPVVWPAREFSDLEEP